MNKKRYERLDGTPATEEELAEDLVHSSLLLFIMKDLSSYTNPSANVMSFRNIVQTKKEYVFLVILAPVNPLS